MQIDPAKLPIDISVTTIRTLCHLYEGDGANVTEIANLLGVSKIAASDLLFKLEKQGRVKRHAVEGDRRQSRFTLTGKGRHYVRSWQPEDALALTH